MTTIRLGCVQYLNALPLIEGLQAWRDAHVVSAVPSRLIDLLLGGEVDVALASVIDGARFPGRTVLLPVGMIGSDGPTLTVRLFSRVPIERVRAVGVDTDSHTSAALLRVVMSRRYGLRGPELRVVDFDARERMVVGDTPEKPAAGPCPAGGGDGIDAMLLIGDKVVTDPPDAEEYPYQLDLGEAWKELTGLPFVYAVWMCRSGEEGSEVVVSAAAMLDRQRRHNGTRLDWLVQSRAGERHWRVAAAAGYVGRSLKYEVGEAEREAVARFIGWSHELGLCAGATVRWAER